MKPGIPLSLTYAPARKRRRWWHYIVPGLFTALAAAGAFLLFVVVTEVFFNRWEPGVWARRFLRFLIGAD